MNRKKITITIIIILIIIVPILILAYDLTSAKTLVDVNSPDSSYKIIVKCKEPFLKGTFSVRIYYKKKNSIAKILLGETVIFHDGAHLNGKNYNLTWDGNTAKLTIMGDQTPYKQIFLINIENSPKIKKQN